MLRGDHTTAVAVIAFSASKNTFGKPRRAQEHFANSCDFDNVYANGNNHE